MKRFLQFATAMLCLALIPCAWVVATETASLLRKAGLAADAVAQVPAMAETRLVALQATVDGIPPIVAKLGTQIAKSADTRIASLQSDVLARVDKIEADANARTGEALALVDARTKVLDDVKPMLANAASIEAHADKLVTDLHPQVLGLVAASKVTAGQTAQTMREIERATPALLENAQGIGKSVEGISAAAKREADELTKPQTLRQKVFAWLGIIPRSVWVGL